MVLLEWWAGLRSWLRLLVALVFMIIGGLMFWYISMRLGIVPLSLGFVMLVFGGKDDSEKKGYHF